MKKSTASIIISVCIIAVGVVALFSVLIIPQISAYTNSMSPVTKLPPYSLYLNILGINENNGYYNVSLAITNTGAVSAQLDKFLINQVRQENIAGLTIYLNGTSVNVAEPLNYNLKCGDILQVNFMAPSTNYTSGSQLRICVSTAQALYFTSGTLP